MSLRSDIQGQQDFLKLEASPTGVFFYYQTTNRFAQAENDAIPDQAIIAELEKLFNQYVSRRKTVKQEVHFHGAYGRVVHNKGYNNDPTAFSEGCRYIIPKCTRADYQLFYDLFHKYLKKDVVYVASNDVYWEYEETGIRIRQADGRPLYMGAAWKTTSYTLSVWKARTTGTEYFPGLGQKTIRYGTVHTSRKNCKKTSKQTRNKLIRPGRLVKGGREFLLIRKQVDIRPSLFLPPTTPWHR